MKHIARLTLPIALAVLFFALPTRGVTNFSVVYYFSSTFGSRQPQAPLVQWTNGIFYGASRFGGANLNGSIFSLTTSGVYTNLKSLTTTNANPVAGLTLGMDGNFYGTSQMGGDSNVGTAFMVTRTGALTTLLSFTNGNGAFPAGRLVQYTNGIFYGLTGSGGLSNKGTVFMMTPAGTLTTLYSFAGTNGSGATPSSLMLASDGNFYGTTTLGGSGNAGSIFKMTPAGVVTTLVNGASVPLGLFAKPSGRLLEASDGFFYGTTDVGGAYQKGAIFRMSPSGSYSNLYSFNNDPGRGPVGGLMQATDGNFYGTCQFDFTYAAGTIFRFTPPGTLATLIVFNGTAGSTFVSSPTGDLIQGLDGKLYGTSVGTPDYGTVFRLDLGLPTNNPSTDRPLLRAPIIVSNVFVIAWPAPSTGYVLQSSDALGNTNWVVVTNPIVVVGSENQVLISPGEQHEFYRLFRWSTPATNATASFTAVPNPATCNQTINFDASNSTASGPGRVIVGYAWDFGDGASASGVQVSHAYSGSGSYPAKLIVTDNNIPPKTATNTINIVVNPGANQAPVASAGGPYTADLDSGVTFDGTASTDPNLACGDYIASYSWNVATNTFDLSGASPSLSSGQITALGVGTFGVVLTVTDSLGAINAVTTTLSIYTNRPVARFTATPNPATCGQSVSFDGSSSSQDRPDRSIVSHAWDFGDGASGSGVQVGHAYSGAGSYPAKLIVTDNNLPPKTATNTINIVVNPGANQAPVASAGGPYTADLGSGITLDGTASTDPNTACGDYIASYSWSVATNAFVLSGASPSLSSGQVNTLGTGTFGVVLTVTDSLGATNAVTTTLSIYTNRPVARFTATPNPATCGQSVSFDGSSSSQDRPDRSIVSHAWDFGDGASGSGVQVSHVYGAYGTYPARLIITDNNLPPKNATNFVTVVVNQGNQAPVASAGGPYSSSLGVAVIFNGADSSDPNAGCGDSIVSYSWNVATNTIVLSGASPTLAAPQVNALGVGTFSVKLTVTDTFGVTNTAATTLQISP